MNSTTASPNASPATQPKGTKINWSGALFLTLTPVFAVPLVWLHLKQDGFMWPIWVMAAVFYALTASSITGGYHRCFAHKTYESRGWLKLYWAFFGAAAFQNSILIWARDHRAHHRFVDTDQDPYSISKGFWYAHLGWMLVNEVPTPDMSAYGRDLERDPIVRIQDRYYIPIAIFAGFVLPTLIGWALGSAMGGLAVIGVLRIVMVHHGTFFINSWCHWFGRQTYTDQNSAKDSLIMAVLTFGEGYHNFHHIFAGDYRNGVRWYHWDPTKWMIQFFSLVGGAHTLRRVPDSEIIRLQLEMAEKKLKNRVQPQFLQQLAKLKQDVHAAQKRFEELTIEYKKAMRDYAATSAQRIAELRLQLRLAKIEFQAALEQWRAYRSHALALHA